MNVVHVALCGPVTDGMTYQENLLSKYHQKMGNVVTVVCSYLIWGQDGKLGLADAADVINSDGIRLLRLQEKHNHPSAKLKVFPKLYATLTELQPDILFIHGCQFCDIRTIVKYLKRHPKCRAWIDNHADLGNSGNSWLSRNILHKVIWRYYANMIDSYVNKFYGVLPSRVEFLHKMYGIPYDRIELLTMGADDEEIQAAKERNARQMMRKQYNIPEHAFVIGAGGKIDANRSAYLDVIRAVMEINQKTPDHPLFLLLFGSISNDVRDIYHDLIQKSDHIIYVGWCNKGKIYDLHQAADLFIHPCLHSVMWEETAGNGVPAIYHKLDGVDHLECGGNCVFIDHTDEKAIKEAILYCMEHYSALKNRAEEVAYKFLYSGIAETSIDEYRSIL